MQYGKWYTGYGSTVAEIDEEIERRRRKMLAIVLRNRPDKRVDTSSLADDAWLRKRRAERHDR